MKFASLLVAIATIASMACATAEEAHHHHHMAADVDAFHAVLAPVWHAKPGPERSRNACAKTPEMIALAGKIRSRDGAALQASLASLKGRCDDGKGEIDAAFYDVHEAFHRLLEQKAAK